LNLNPCYNTGMSFRDDLWQITSHLGNKSPGRQTTGRKVEKKDHWAIRLGHGRQNWKQLEHNYWKNEPRRRGRRRP